MNPDSSIVRLLTIIFLLAMGQASFVSSPAIAKDGVLTVTVVDQATDEETWAIMTLKNASGKSVIPKKVMSLGSAFVISKTSELELPPNKYQFKLSRGLEYKSIFGEFEITSGARDSQTIQLERFTELEKTGYRAIDLGMQIDVAKADAWSLATNCAAVNVLSWTNQANAWNEKAAESPWLKLAEGRFAAVIGGIDHRGGGGLIALNSSVSQSLDGFQPEWPSSVDTYRFMRADPQALIFADDIASWDLPLWVAEGGIEGACFFGNLQSPTNLRATAEKPVNPKAKKSSKGKSNATKSNSDSKTNSIKLDLLGIRPPLINGKAMTRTPDNSQLADWREAIYFHLLNAGFRVSPVTASLDGFRGAIPGQCATFVYSGGATSSEAYVDHLKRGNLFVSNGPILRVTCNNQLPGTVFNGREGESVELNFGASFSTRTRIDFIEMIQNGKVIHQVPLGDLGKQKGALPTVTFNKSGWVLVRVREPESPNPQIAMTAPFYVQIGDRESISRSATRFFLDWLSERKSLLQHTDPEQKQKLIDQLEKAEQFWQQRQRIANVE
jgi:hypothetical protein